MAIQVWDYRAEYEAAREGRLPLIPDHRMLDFRALWKELPCGSHGSRRGRSLGILKESEAGIPIADLVRKHGISRATYFNWRSKYAGTSISELKRLKELETENATLKRMYAELALENAAITDVLSRKR